MYYSGYLALCCTVGDTGIKFLGFASLSNIDSTRNYMPQSQIHMQEIVMSYPRASGQHRVKQYSKKASKFTSPANQIELIKNFIIGNTSQEVVV